MKSIFQILLLAILVNSCQPPVDILDVGIPLEMAEYRKEQVSDVVYTLSFDIPAEKENPIPAVLDLSLTISRLDQPLYLDFNEVATSIQSIDANGTRVPTDHRKEHVIIASEHLKKGENKIQIEFYAGELSLNRNEDFLYTLLVPDRASTLFPCFDQPDIKANYVLNITAPSDWKVLCGAPELEQVSKGASVEHRFGKTEKMSTYLFSFVAGKFQNETQNPGSFDMTLLYRETNKEKKEASLDQIFKHHQQSIDFLEDYTGYPFPFQKLDFAAIPGFQYGGMEHVGAIQYRESSLFLDNSATESRKLSRGKLIAHETAHMWFGDLVTMKWFNDVWMKEVFANFMADKIVNPSFPEINHNLQFVTNHYPSAYSEDRTAGTNPIRQQLDNLKNAGTLYGRIIYNKAPIMMRQLEATMGKEAFQEGIKEYIKTYENGNAEWSHLVNIFDGKTDLDMKQWSDVWVNQSGRPILSDKISYGELDKITSFEISQKAEDGSTKLWPQSFKVGLIYPDSIVELAVQIAGEQTTIEEAIGLPKPTAVVYNYDGFGYGVFPTEKSSLEITPTLTDEVARGYSYINAYENVLNGNISANDALQVLQAGLNVENNELIIGLMSNQIRTLFWKYLNEEDRSEMQPVLQNQSFGLLQKDLPANIKKTLFRLYSSIAYSPAGAEQLYKIWNRKLVIEELKLNTDDYANLAMNLAIYGHEKAGDIIRITQDSFENLDKKERFNFLIPSLSANETDRDDFFESLRFPKNREKEAWVQTAISNIHHPLRHTSSTKLLRTSLDLLEEIQITGDIFFPKRWLVSTIGNYSSAEAHQIVEDYLSANPDLTPSLRNKLLQAADDLYRVQELQK